MFLHASAKIFNQSNLKYYFLFKSVKGKFLISIYQFILISGKGWDQIHWVKMEKKTPTFIKISYHGQIPVCFKIYMSFETLLQDYI